MSDNGRGELHSTEVERRSYAGDGPDHPWKACISSCTLNETARIRTAGIWQHHQSQISVTDRKRYTDSWPTRTILPRPMVPSTCSMAGLGGKGTIWQHMLSQSRSPDWPGVWTKILQHVPQMQIGSDNVQEPWITTC